MIRYLIVELEGLRPRYGDSPKRPNDKKTPVPRVIVSPDRFWNRNPRRSPESVQNLTISACCSSHGAEGLLGLGPHNSLRESEHAWLLSAFIAEGIIPGSLDCPYRLMPARSISRGSLFHMKPTVDTRPVNISKGCLPKISSANKPARLVAEVDRVPMEAGDRGRVRHTAVDGKLRLRPFG